MTESNFDFEIKSYIQELLDANKEISFPQFLKDKELLIVDNSKPDQDYKDFWSDAFALMATELGATLNKKKRVSWKAIDAKVNDRQGNHSANNLPSSASVPPSTGTKRSRNSSSKSDSNELTDAMKMEYRNAFEALDNSKKWSLGDGVFVEDKMYEFGCTRDHEHLAHSFVMDVDDPCWIKVFSPEQLATIKSTGNQALPNYNSDLNDMFNSFSSVVKEMRTGLSVPLSANEESAIIDALWAKVTEPGFFNPKFQFDQSWVQRTMIEVLELYRWNVLSWVSKNGSEMDFVTRIWSLMLDNLFIETHRDQVSVAVTATGNRGRPVTGLAPISAEAPSIRPDLVLFRNEIEYGAAECGKENDAGIGKKEVVETQLHCPKVMKSMLMHATSKCNEREDILRSLRIIGYYHFHLRMRVTVLDSPGGYVCRVRTTPQYQMPTSPSLMPSGLFPILKLTLKAKEAIRSSIQTVEVYRAETDEDPDVVSNMDTGRTLTLPPVAKFGEKKQKTA